MTPDRLISMLALSALLSACTTQPPTPLAATARADETKGKTQLHFQMASGVYRCELDQKVEIQRDLRNADLIELGWRGNRHTLQRYDSSSGLPRYEDRKNGLLWIDLPWKSVLMDVNSGRPLANDCKATRS